MEANDSLNFFKKEEEEEQVYASCYGIPINSDVIITNFIEFDKKFVCF